MVESVCALSQTCEAAVEFREIHALLIKRRRVTRNSQFAQVEAEREALTLFKVCTQGRTGSESARVTGPATSYTSWISLVIEGRIVESLSTIVNCSRGEITEFDFDARNHLLNHSRTLSPRAAKRRVAFLFHCALKLLASRENCVTVAL